MDTELRLDDATVAHANTTVDVSVDHVASTEEATPSPHQPEGVPIGATTSIEDEIPDVEMLTIKNLDTGEQYIIGENDPDFDFDTFELRKGVEATPIVATAKQQQEMVDAANGKGPAAADEEFQRPPPKEARKSFWLHFLNVIYGSKNSKKKEEQAKLGNEYSVVSKPKTPFTKLSNFKFRKELGRGAFGRVLLAESKLDGKLFALKIITKKNMRSSDKRQAKAERDILHAMTLKAPHPFTSGLKFAFQSENNLYLGMDYIPGGNLRELIKKFKFLPEVRRLCCCGLCFVAPLTVCVMYSMSLCAGLGEILRR
jgi:hypothetical protein